MPSQIVMEDLERVLAARLPWEAFEGRTVLISGANGFLPAYMVETLLRRSETRKNKTTIIALCRDANRAQKRFVEYASRPELRLAIQDVCEPLKLNEPVDYMIHAASQASPKYYGQDPAGTLLANVTGTLNLLSLAREQKSRGFLFFSSGEVYGKIGDDQIPTREDQYGVVDPMDVRSCYAESKRLGETACASWHAQFGVPALAVRPFHTYGPGMALNDGRVFADFVGNVLRGENIELKSDGSARRAFCYLADATEGFFTALLKGTPGQAYNVGNPGGESSIFELAQTVAGLFPEKGLKATRVLAAQPAGYLRSPISRNCPNIDKIKALGWTPDTSIEAGFRRTILSYGTC